MPLIFAKIGEKVKIDRVLGSESQTKHLKDLGFVKDEILNIISNNDGDIIVEIKGSKLAITKEMARKIIIK